MKDDTFDRARDPQAADSVSAPTKSEIDQWAEEQRRRRQEWLAGPSEEEKDEWARRETARRRATSTSGRLENDDLNATLNRATADADALAQHLVRTIVRLPVTLFSTFLDAGLRAQRDLLEQSGRVPFPPDFSSRKNPPR